MLAYGEQGIKLDLFGDLSNLTTTERGIVQERSPIPIIHGLLDTGKPCTLHKVAEMNCDMLLGVEGIPSGTSSSLRSALTEKLKYGNEHSLRRRIGEILKSLENETIALIIPNADAFKNGVADTRNYYTHYTDELKKKALSGRALWRANQRLKILLTMILLKEVGVKEDSIRRVIANNPRLMQIIHLHLRSRG